MAKRKADSPAPVSSKPDNKRFVAKMLLVDRRRLRNCCEAVCEEMAVVGRRWIVARLTDEERKLGKAK